MSLRQTFLLGGCVATLGAGGLVYWMVSNNEKKNSQKQTFNVSPGQYKRSKTEGQDDMSKFDDKKLMAETIFESGPSDWNELRRQTNERRKRLAEEYGRAQYERVKKMQEAERKEAEEAEKAKKD